MSTPDDAPDPLDGFQGSVGHPERFVQLAFQLNGLLDKGCSVSSNETFDRIRDGSLFDWLGELYPFDSYAFDLSGLDAGERRTILKVFEMTDGVIAAQNGLAVLLSYCLVVLQNPGTYADDRFDE